MGPLFPYLKAVVFRLFGQSQEPVHVVLYLFGIITSGLVYLTASAWFSNRVALLAGLFCAVSPTLLFYESTLLPASLILLGVSCFLYFVSRIELRPNSWWLWIGLGLVLGITSMQRGNLLLCAIGVVFWVMMAFSQWTMRRKSFTILLFTISVLLGVMPCLLHNRLIGGKWVLLTSNGPINFYMGNGAGASGVFTYPPRFDELSTKRNEMNQELKQLIQQGKETNPNNEIQTPTQQQKALKKKIENIWRAALIEDISSQPIRWTGLMARKFYYFWAAYDSPDNFSYDFAKRFSSVLRINPFGYALIVPLGLIGMVLAFPRRKSLAGLYTFAMTYCISVVLVFISGRFRIPILLVMHIFAAYLVLQLWAWLRHGSIHLVILSVTSIAALVFVLSLYQINTHNIRSSDFINGAKSFHIIQRPVEAYDLLSDGIKYFTESKPEDKKGQQEKIVGIYLIRNGLIQMHLQDQQWPEAEKELRTLFQSGYAQAEHREMLILALVKQGKLKQAEQVMQATQ